MLSSKPTFFTLPVFLLSAFVLTSCGGGGGSSGTTGDSGFDNVVAIIVPAGDGSGDIYVGGAFTRYDGVAANGLIRLHGNGTIDTGFVSGLPVGYHANKVAVAGDGSGDVYVSNGSSSVPDLSRINSDGVIDTGFNIGSGFNDEIDTIEPVLDNSGDVYAGGWFTTYRKNTVNGIVRINSDGSSNVGFNQGTGFSYISYAADLATLVPALDNSGDVYVGGWFDTYRGNSINYIVRINSDGSYDAGFDQGSGFDDYVNIIAPAVDSSGDIYVGGGFSSYRGNTRNRIARINSDGSNDAGFDPGSGFTGSGAYVVNTIVPDVDGSGDIYVGGYFTGYSGTVANHIIRLHSDGSIDTSFDTGSGFSGSSYVSTIALANDGTGDVFVGGTFASYNGTTVSANIIRLHRDGSIDTTFN